MKTGSLCCRDAVVDHDKERCMADMLSKLKRADEDMLLENLSRRGFIKVTSCAALGLATLQASEALATMKASPLVIM